jgi:hypothetical protein
MNHKLTGFYTGKLYVGASYCIIKLYSRFPSCMVTVVARKCGVLIRR